MAEGDNAGGEAQAATGSAGIAWDGVRLPGLDATRVALVTGAAGAIGGSVVHALAALGVRVGVLGRSETAVRHAVADCRRAEPDQLLPLVGDVSVQADMARCVDAVTARWGRLDVLVHAAAIGDPKSTLRDVTPEGIDHMLAVNVKGTLLIAQAAAEPMRAQGSGSMILLASVGAFRAGPTGAVYGATKAAVVRLARQLAVELGPSGIRVNSVSPGQTPTVLRGLGEPPGAPPRASAGGNAATIPLRRRGALDDYAGAVVFLASDLASYITGADILVDGGVAVRR